MIKLVVIALVAVVVFATSDVPRHLQPPADYVSTDHLFQRPFIKEGKIS